MTRLERVAHVPRQMRKTAVYGVDKARGRGDDVPRWVETYYATRWEVL